MKIYFEHILGKQTNQDIRYIDLCAKVEQHEEKDALEQGWLIDKHREWYQSRSTRIKVSDYESKSKWPKNLEIKIGKISDFDRQKLEQIYNDYLKYKNYPDKYNFFNFLDDRDNFMVVFDGESPVAFTKFTKYNGALESFCFCWNYHKPKLSIGKLIQGKEIEYAKSLNLEYLYIGSGYEEACIYKSKFPGFEWWTGSEWSKDKEKYKLLCERDSKINTISDLDNLIL